MRCAVDAAFEATAIELRQSLLVFVGRAEAEARVHEVLEREKYNATRIAGDLAQSTDARPEAIAAASRLAPRPVETIALLCHEEWEASRLLHTVHKSLGGLYLRSGQRGYGLSTFGDELLSQEIETLQRLARAFVLVVSTSGATMAPMNRTLQGVRASGIPLVALWLVGDAPCPSPIRDRRELQVRRALDQAGIDADTVPVLHAHKVERESLQQLGELLDEQFSQGIAEVLAPAEIAVQTFHHCADEQRWQDALQALTIAYARHRTKTISSSLVTAAVRALRAQPFSVVPLQILANAKDPQTIEPLLAFLQETHQCGDVPGTALALVCELLFELGERRHESIAWEAYANAVDPLRKEFESMMRKAFGKSLLPVIEARLESLSPEDPLRPAFEKLRARWRRRNARKPTIDREPR